MRTLQSIEAPYIVPEAPAHNLDSRRGGCAVPVRAGGAPSTQVLMAVSGIAFEWGFPHLDRVFQFEITHGSHASFFTLAKK